MTTKLNFHQPHEKEQLQEKQSKEENDYKNKTIYEKLRVCYVKTNITVEPMMACLVIASMLSKLAIQKLNLEKTCRLKLNLSQEICDAFIRRQGSLLTEQEIAALKIISSIETWKSVIQTAIPTFLIIFMGAWSDRTGNRKLCIVLPIIGEFLACLSNVISTFFFNEISVEVTMLCQGLFPAITGGWVLVYLGVFSYISDISTPKTRTFRIGLVSIFLTAGIPLGAALSEILLRLLGYYGIFAISGSIYLFTLTYGAVCLKRNTKPNSDGNEIERTNFWDILYLVKETAAVAYKKRGGNCRKSIILTLLIVAIVYGPNHGERIVFYLYLRYRLNWDASIYSVYSTYSIITHTLGAIFSITVFSKFLGYHDSVLCLISVISKLAGSVAIIFVQTSLQMFMIPIIEFFKATTFISLRSMASKLVPAEEMGKMNSLFSLVETTAALLFDPAYARVHSLTVGQFPGGVFVLSAFMTLMVIGLLLWFLEQHRIEARQRQRQAQAISETDDEVVNEQARAIEMAVTQCDVRKNNQ